MPSKPSFSRSHIIKMICSAGALLLFFLVFNLPAAHEVTRLKQELAKTEFAQKEQRAFFPLYAQCRQILDRPTSVLPLPKASRLDFDSIPGLTPRISALAQDYQLQPQRVQCEPATLGLRKGTILLDLDLKGQLQDFWDFFLEIGALPYVESIQSLHITQQPGNTSLFQIRAWVNVKQVRQEG